MDGDIQQAGASSNIDRHDAILVLDPLSQQINRRLNAPNPPVRTYSQPISVDGSILHDHQTSHTPSDGVMGILKDKTKNVRILNRFIGHRKKDNPPDDVPVAQKSVEHRPEGADAEIYYEPLDNVEYNPRHLQLPPYIKVRSHGKKEKDFNRLFLAQELHINTVSSTSRNNSDPSSIPQRHKAAQTDNAIWAMEFSHDGKYLAVAGQDSIVRIWAVLASREDRRMLEKEEEVKGQKHGRRSRLSAPVFREWPFRILQGHEKAILDLSWSKNNFLLSSSMDKTVRLWHISRKDCLCAFKHSDFVTSIQFHPQDDRFFLAGSLDSKIRLWSIPDKSVAFWNQASDMVTAVTFTPDGKTAIAGCRSGLCIFYETEGMKYHTQIYVKSAHGKNSKGSKITGLQTTNVPANDPNGDVKLIVTSNDSRVRWYNVRDKSLEMKFKGNQNASGQIHARLSDDAKYIICGSEDKKVFIWSAGSAEAERRDKNRLEYFDAHSTSTTVAVIAPTKTRQLLSNAEDPVYDTCNPPPVTLMSRAEIESIHSSKPPTENGSIQPTPSTAEGGGAFKRPEASASYLARSTHRDGNIIITASQGVIKVYRQDCAWEKWRPDVTDASSIFSKQASSRIGIVRRQASQLTQSSARSRRNSNSTQPGRERVLTWRQSIASMASVDRASIASQNTPHKDRSRSPQKIAPSPLVTRKPSGASDAPTTTAASDTNSFVTAASNDSASKTPDRVHPEINLERQDSGTYWEQNAWRSSVLQQIHGSDSLAKQRIQQQEAGRLGVPGAYDLSRRTSGVSTLSDEVSSDVGLSSGGEDGGANAAKRMEQTVRSKHRS